MSDEADRGEVVYSVVVPVYNTVESVRELVERLTRVFEDEVGEPYEIILVDDGSENAQTWATLEQLVREWPCVVAIRLTRNFGKASAMICGFERARGDWVVTMDDDLEHLPEDLPRFIAQRDHDVVMGSYEKRNHPLSKRITSRVKNWFDRVLAGRPANMVTNPYRLHNAGVVRAICAMKGPYPFISAMMYYATRDIVTVTITHGTPANRSSQFNARRRLRSFATLLINRSAFLTRAIAIVGLLISAIALIAGGYHLGRSVFGDGSFTFQDTMLICLVVVNGLVLSAVAVTGEYLTRTLAGVERRPPYLVRQVLDGGPTAA